jgi:hypothetical protein
MQGIQDIWQAQGPFLMVLFIRCLQIWNFLFLGFGFCFWLVPLLGTTCSKTERSLMRTNSLEGEANNPYAQLVGMDPYGLAQAAGV